jgi:hypothetical protein
VPSQHPHGEEDGEEEAEEEKEEEESNGWKGRRWPLVFAEGRRLFWTQMSQNSQFGK